MQGHVAGAISVVVAGGGIGGLTAALALARAGAAVTVLEQVSQHGEVGAGLTVTPNASRALISLGLGEVLARIGSSPSAGAILEHRHGRVLVPLPQDGSRQRYGAPLFHVHRADLHAALVAALEQVAPGALILGAQVVDFEQRGDRVVVKLAGGREVGADALVGCDGVRSTVRSLCHGDSAPEFTGFVAWRGLVPAALLPGPASEPGLGMWIGPQRLFMRYRLRAGALFNYVAIARRDTWAEEGWSVRCEPAELRGEFADFEPRVQATLDATPLRELHRWGIFARRPLARWTIGRVTLLGDAAHAMPPFLGQGAVMAIEDAVVLGRAFAESTKVPEALERYESARRPRTTLVMQAAQARGALYFADDPQAQLAAIAAGMDEQRVLYEYDASTVTIS